MDDFEDELALMEQFGAIKLQSIVRMILVRSRIIKQINERYEKIFDPRRQRYYYYDRINDTSSWGKPLLLRNSDIKIVSPTFIDESALKMDVEEKSNKIHSTSDVSENDDDDDDDDDDDEIADDLTMEKSKEESDLDSDDSEAVRERRRLRRKYPRYIFYKLSCYMLLI